MLQVHDSKALGPQKRMLLFGGNGMNRKGPDKDRSKTWSKCLKNNISGKRCPYRSRLSWLDRLPGTTGDRGRVEVPGFDLSFLKIHLDLLSFFSNKKLVVTSATLVVTVTGALLVVTRS